MRPDHEAWIRNKFAEAQVILEPFPHLFIRDVLPPEVYREMRECIPTERSFRTMLLWAHLAKLSKRLGRFWRVQNAPPVYVEIDPIFSPYIDLIEKLIHEALGVNANWKTGQRLFFWRPKSWFILPHTHSPAELTNSIIYFPTEKNTPDQGTVLYRTNNEPAAIFPFVPNSMVSWVNSEKSVHGSFDIRKQPPRRYFYFVSVSNH